APGCNHSETAAMRRWDASVATALRPDLPKWLSRRPSSRRPRRVDTVNGWLRLRLIAVIVGILVTGFVATDVLSYREAVEDLKQTILHDELPLTGSNIYSEVQ